MILGLSGGGPPTYLRALTRVALWHNWTRRTLWLVLCCFGISAQAHRPTESSAEFRWEHGRLESRTTFPTTMAARLLGDPAATLGSVADFTANRGRLEKVMAEGMLVVVDGNPVKPAQTSVELTSDGEVVSISVFPPLAMGALTVNARFLNRTSPDCFCILSVWESADRLLGKRLLVRSAPEATVAAGPPSRGVSAGSAKPMPPSANSSAPHPSPPSPQKN